MYSRLFFVILATLFMLLLPEQTDAFLSPSFYRTQKLCIHDESEMSTHSIVSRTIPSDDSKFSTVLFSEPPRKSVNEIIGIQRGLYLLGIVMIFNVWIFSIPPEFRRAKICTEEQVVMYPNSGCMTGNQWIGGIKEYYTNGGGINFDFTIERSQQPAWMGGDQPFQK